MQFSRSLILLPVLLLGCSSEPAPLPPDLAPDQVVSQLLDDARELLLENLGQMSDAAKIIANLPSPEPGDFARELQPTFTDFEPYAARAVHPATVPPLGDAILLDLLGAVMPLVFDPDSEPGGWTHSTRTTHLEKDLEPPQAEVEALFFTPVSKLEVYRVYFHLLKRPEGWRISRMVRWVKPARRFDLEAILDQAAWRIRRDGDELATTSVREITLVVLDPGRLVPDMSDVSRGWLKVAVDRMIGFLDGPALPADRETMLSWLDGDPAAIDLRLEPAGGCTIQDVYHAIDALFEAGVTHLSLVTSADDAG